MQHRSAGALDRAAVGDPESCCFDLTEPIPSAKERFLTPPCAEFQSPSEVVLEESLSQPPERKACRAHHQQRRFATFDETCIPVAMHKSLHETLPRRQSAQPLVCGVT